VDREHLLRLLAAYQQKYPEEASCVERFIEFVNSNSRCFERSLTSGHVTGSAWVVNRAGTHTLLTHHRKLNKWLQPGGHADGNPDVLDVAFREAQEETGITEFKILSKDIFDLDIHRIPARKSEPSHYHYDARFMLQTVHSEAYQVSDESYELAWVAIRQLRQFSQEESMLRMAGKWETVRLNLDKFC